MILTSQMSVMRPMTATSSFGDGTDSSMAYGAAGAYGSDSESDE